MPLIGVDAPVDAVLDGAGLDGGRLNDATAVCGAALDVPEGAEVDDPGNAIELDAAGAEVVAEATVAAFGVTMLLGNVNPLDGDVVESGELVEPPANRVGVRLFNGGIANPLPEFCCGLLATAVAGDDAGFAPS